MTLAIFGGSFDPVHKGHIAIARAAMRVCGYDRIVFVPAKRPPHKVLSPGASDADRLAMLKLAVAEQREFSVDDCELVREGISWTIDTVRHIAKKMIHDGKPGLVIGDDLAPGFPSWKEPDALAGECDIVIARRTGRVATDFPYPHRTVMNDIIPCSSSAVRAMAAQGRLDPEWLCESVAVYIRERRLYGYRQDNE